MHGPWIITRPRDEAQRDVSALRAHGVEALALPLLERVNLPWSSMRPDLVLITSSAVIPAVRRVWNAWSPAPTLAAMAPETVAKVRAAGLPVDVEARGGAVALAETVVAQWESLGGPRTALYPTSRAGLESPEQTAAMAILETRLQVWRVAVLDLVRPENLDERLAQAPADARWVLASPSAVVSLAATADLPVPALILCYGASTLRACAGLLPAGWPAPLLATATSVVDAVLAAEANSSPPLETR